MAQHSGISSSVPARACVCVCECWMRERKRHRMSIDTSTVWAVARIHLAGQKTKRIVSCTEHREVTENWFLWLVRKRPLPPPLPSSKCNDNVGTRVADKNRPKHNKDGGRRKKWNKHKHHNQILLPFKYQFWIWSRSECGNDTRLHGISYCARMCVCCFGSAVHWRPSYGNKS